VCVVFYFIDLVFFGVTDVHAYASCAATLNTVIAFDFLLTCWEIENERSLPFAFFPLTHFLVNAQPSQQVSGRSWMSNNVDSQQYFSQQQNKGLHEFASF
jgi:hypothetical protein